MVRGGQHQPGAFDSDSAAKTGLTLVLHQDHVGQLVTRLNDQLETWLTDRMPNRSRKREHFLQLLAVQQADPSRR